ncbi:aspartate/glutamate racemase family protein [Chloroflexota bacterium]
MRIWYQTSSSIGKAKRYDDYEATLKSYLSQVARPGTEVSVHGVEHNSTLAQTFMYEELLHDHQIIENLLKAQQDGYDAFCVTCMYDPAFYALREVADIPVLSLAEASMLSACLLSPNFSILCHHKPLLRRLIELVKRYGLQDRFIECDSFEIGTVKLFDSAFKNPEIILEPAREVAREAARKGVCMFISGGGAINMILAKHNVHQIEGIPILEGGGALLKMTEMLVDLKNIGIERTKLGLYTPIPKEDLTYMRKLYGLE